MDIKKPIETERLVLRLFDPDKPSDYEELRLIFDDEFVAQTYGVPSSTTNEGLDHKAAKHALPRELCTKHPPPSHQNHLIYLKSTGKLLGLVEISKRKGVPPDLGFAIFEQFNGHGYATEASRAAIAFWTDVIGLEKIFVGTFDSNIAPQRVAQKCGFVPGGTLTVILPQADCDPVQCRAFILPGTAPFEEGLVVTAVED